MFRLTTQDWIILLPVLVLAAGAITVVVGDLLGPGSDAKRRALHVVAVVSCAAALGLTAYQYSPATYKAGEVIEHMGPSLRDVWSFRMQTVVGALILEALTFLVLLLSGSFLADEDDPHHAEYHALLLFFTIGGILMVSAKHLMLAFVGLELLSVSLYVLVAIRRTRYPSVEAGLKYFLLGAFAAAIFLYGTALLYAGNGSLSLLGIDAVNRPGSVRPEGLAALGGGLLFVALFFKASVVPFHMWTPDVYQGAPTPITALMSTGTKTAAFLLLMSAAPLIPREILAVLPLVTVLTIVVGNFGALVQSDVKRLLAYSGIAHAGYVLVAFSALCIGPGAQDAAYATRAILFYLAAYGFTNVAAFAVLGFLEKSDPSIVTLDGLEGLSRRNPASAVVIALAMFSLAGIPPLVGFWGKYLVFAAALRAGLPLLAITGIVFSVVGLYYYLQVVVCMFFRPAPDPRPIAARGAGARIAIVLAGAAIVVLGVLPGLLLDSLVHIRL